jgi:RNA polymerase sigma factor (sigma-70 family)
MGQMPESDDHRVLAEFVRDRSETAFTELVRRYAGLVHSTAFRFCGNPHHAEEITQSVFVILARKAETLSPRVVVSGWLYQTARLTAANFVKGEMRRRRREQEAVMQSNLLETGSTDWEKIAPLLDDAMGALGETDRNAVLLRYFENRTSSEIGVALRMNEETARKRVNRALEKLRHFFVKRGVTVSSAALSGAISANSVQPISAFMVKSISAVALAKGATASTSTLTLIKGALKIMAWTKAKTAIVAGVVVLLAAGTATVTVKEFNEHRVYSWQLPHFASTNFMNTLAIVHSVVEQTAPQVRIVPTIHPHGLIDFPCSVGGISAQWIDGKIVTHTNPVQFLGLGITVHEMVQLAYMDWGDDRHTLFTTPLPQGLYDSIANLPHGAPEALQSEIKRKFGLVGTWRMVETNVLLLKRVNPDVHGFKPTGSLMREMNLNTNSVGGPMTYEEGMAEKDVSTRSNDVFRETMYRFNSTPAILIKWNNLEDVFNLPIIDETGLTNRYDFATTFVFNIPKRGAFGNPDKEMWRKVLVEQLGLELVPARRPVRMLVVEKAK